MPTVTTTTTRLTWARAPMRFIFTCSAVPMARMHPQSTSCRYARQPTASLKPLVASVKQHLPTIISTLRIRLSLVALTSISALLQRREQLQTICVWDSPSFMYSLVHRKSRMLLIISPWQMKRQSIQGLPRESIENLLRNSIQLAPQQSSFPVCHSPVTSTVSMPMLLIQRTAFS